MNSLGYIEVVGLVTLIEAADAALKAANVTLVGKENPGAGMVALVLKGEIGDVRAAVDAGVEAAARVGKVVGSNVIARPYTEAK